VSGTERASARPRKTVMPTENLPDPQFDGGKLYARKMARGLPPGLAAVFRTGVGRMRVLGVHATSSTLWFACADNDGLIDIGADYRLELPKALESGDALVHAREDVQRIIRRHHVRRARLLSAEGTFKSTYSQFVPRITMETVVAFACAAEGIEFLRMARPTVRTHLGLPMTNKLKSYADRLGEQQTPNWGPDKRDLAAMVAVAGVKESGDLE
jgi:hypothetical protein